MTKNCLKFKKGYAALMSTLVISFILSAVVLAGSFESFFGRQALLNRELKEISLNLAEGCLDKAILIIVQSPNFEINKQNQHNETLFSDAKNNLSCRLKALEKSEERATIKIQAEAGKAITNLEAVFDERLLEIVSIKEIARLE